jgi:hypothetical protein
MPWRLTLSGWLSVHRRSGRSRARRRPSCRLGRKRGHASPTPQVGAPLGISPRLCPASRRCQLKRVCTEARQLSHLKQQRHRVELHARTGSSHFSMLPVQLALACPVNETVKQSLQIIGQGRNLIMKPDARTVMVDRSLLVMSLRRRLKRSAAPRPRHRADTPTCLFPP